MDNIEKNVYRGGGKPKPIDMDKLAELCEKYERGEITRPQMAQELNLSVSTLLVRLRKLGLTEPENSHHKGAPPMPYDKNKLLALYEQYRQGEITLAYMGREMNMCFQTLTRHMEELGLPKGQEKKIHKHRKYVDKAQLTELVERYDRYEITRADMARELQVSKATLREYLKEYGLFRGNNPGESGHKGRITGRLPETYDREKLIALYEKFSRHEITQSALAQEFGITPVTLKRRIKKLGLPEVLVAQKKKIDKDQLAELVAQYDKGEITRIEMARRLHISTTTLRFRMMDYGLWQPGTVSPGGRRKDVDMDKLADLYAQFQKREITLKEIQKQLDVSYYVVKARIRELTWKSAADDNSESEENENGR